MRSKHIPEEDWWEATAPLDRQAMGRIFAEVKRPFAVPERDVEALHIAAAVLSNRLCQMVVAKLPPPPKSRRKDVLRATVELSRQIQAIQEDGYAAPPMLPRAWLAELQRWTRADLRGPGRPKSVSNRTTIPPLLDLYVVAFGVPPSHTRNGPTARFLKAWRKEIEAAVGASADLHGASTCLPILNDSNTLRLIQDWRAEGLRRRVGHKTFWAVVLALDPARGIIHPKA